MNKRRKAKFRVGQSVAVRDEQWLRPAILKLTERYWEEMPGSKFHGWWYRWDKALAPWGYKGMAGISEKHLRPLKRGA